MAELVTLEGGFSFKRALKRGAGYTPQGALYNRLKAQNKRRKRRPMLVARAKRRLAILDAIGRSSSPAAPQARRRAAYIRKVAASGRFGPAVLLGSGMLGKSLFKRIKKGALKISRRMMGPIDGIIAKVLEQKIKKDGGVIKPGLRTWAISNSSTLLSAAGPQASLAKPILPKLIDRAIARLKKKYKAGDDSKGFSLPSMPSKKVMIAGGVGLLLLVFLLKGKKERVEIHTKG